MKKIVFSANNTTEEILQKVESKQKGFFINKAIEYFAKIKEAEILFKSEKEINTDVKKPLKEENKESSIDKKIGLAEWD